MLWKKPADLKYTDLCIYIDQNVPKLLDPDCPDVLKDTIYNYLFLLIKALAIKKRMFNSFQDYDGYSFYAANRIFFALKKNLTNQGKVIKGKEIKPIKSCLNYTKALLYPMKIEYLREEYDIGKAELETSKNFDQFVFKQQMRDYAWQQQGKSFEFKSNVEDLFKNFNFVLTRILQASPFHPGTVDYKRIKISILFNVLNNLKQHKSINTEPVTVILWKLPKSMATYIKVFLKKLGTAMAQEIMESYEDVQIDDRLLDYMLTNPDGEFIDHENNN